MDEAGPTAPAGVHHVAILVGDLAAAEAFYGGLLRLPVIRRWPADPAQPDGAERSIWLDAGGGAFLALERAPSAQCTQFAQCTIDEKDPDEPGPHFEEESPGWHLVALRIAREDRPHWERRLAEAGVAIYRRTDYTLYVRDPEGNRVGLSHWPDRRAE